MTAIATILPNGRKQFLSATGAPLAGGSVAYYIPGTTTLKTTWIDGAQVTPNTNPVTLDAAGSALVWGAGSYREYVTDSLGNLISDSVTSSLSDVSQLNYTPAGANAVARSASSKFAEWVSSADYGCVGDGVTDDTTDFMRAVSAAIALGVPLLVTGLSGHIIRLSSTQTIGCALVFAAGGQLKPDSTATITLGQGCMAPITQIFSGAGTVVVAASKAVYIPVAWYGAVADGVTDDTSAVQKAITAATTAGGGRLFFHQALFYFTGKLTITGNNISLIGAGRGATFLRFANGAQDCIVVGASYTSVVYTTYIQDMDIDGSAKTGGNGVSLLSSANSFIQRVTFSNMANGLYVQYINNVSVEDCIILVQNASGYGWGIKWYSVASAIQTSNVLALTNVTINCNGTGASGIVVDGACNTLRVQSVGVIHAYVGLLIENTQASNTYYPQFIFCDDLEIDGVTSNCVSILGGRHIRFVNCDFFSNYSGETTDTDCIYIAADGTASVTTAIWFTACRIAGAQHRGIYCEAKNVNISACYIGDNSLAGSGLYSGIALGSNGGANGGAQSVTITGGQIGAVFGDIGNQAYAVTVASGVYRVAMSAVDTSNCVTGAFQDNTGGLGNVRWTGCINIDGTQLPDRMPIVSVDPVAPVEGVIWENITTHTLKVYLNGAVKTISAA